MLLRNWNVEDGLTNGTRLRVTRLRNRQGDPLSHLLECKVITNNGDAERTVWVPRMAFTVTSDVSGLDYDFKRVQFPVTLAFAMTIHKSQGQTFDKVGIYLEHPVFTHGQLYVAMSRCRNPDHLKVFNLCDSDNETLRKSTVNIVWQDVLYDDRQVPRADHPDEQPLVNIPDEVIAHLRPDGVPRGDDPEPMEVDLDSPYTIPEHNSNLRRRNV